MALVGTIIVFWKNKRSDRPWIVTYLWILIDLACFTSVLYNVFFVSDDFWGLQFITISILLDLMIHQAFAMEYLKAALYIPIIMDLMTVDA